jgi:hypothetical protein
MRRYACAGSMHAPGYACAEPPKSCAGVCMRREYACAGCMHAPGAVDAERGLMGDLWRSMLACRRAAHLCWHEAALMQLMRRAPACCPEHAHAAGKQLCQEPHAPGSLQAGATSCAGDACTPRVSLAPGSSHAEGMMTESRTGSRMDRRLIVTYCGYCGANIK